MATRAAPTFETFEDWFASLRLEGICPKTGIRSRLLRSSKRFRVYVLELGWRVMEHRLDLAAMRRTWREEGDFNALCILIAEHEEAALTLGYELAGP